MLLYGKNKKKQKKESTPVVDETDSHSTIKESTEINQSPKDAEVDPNSVDTILPGDNNDTKILIDQSVSATQPMLPPHHSILQALNNPDLELSINENIEFDRSKFFQNSNINNGFSMTSWQSISCFQDLDPLNTPKTNSHTNSSAILTNNNNNNNNNSNNNNTNNNREFSHSPYVGSILSSSDNEERDDRNLDDEIPSMAITNHEVLFMNSDSEVDDDLTDEDLDLEFDDERLTSDSFSNNPTAVPSFVMPRISVSGSLDEDSFKKKIKRKNVHSSSSSKDKVSGLLSIQVIGPSKESLIKRLGEYSKSLNHIKFTNKNPHLILLIVNADNYILPNLLNKPFIPILIEETKESLKSPSSSQAQSKTLSLKNEEILKKIIFKSTMICEPLRLKSLDDDLMGLIEFLSTLDPYSFKEIYEDMVDKKVLFNTTSFSDLNSSGAGGAPVSSNTSKDTLMSLSQANSLFIKKNASLLNGPGDESRSVLETSTRRRSSMGISHYYDHIKLFNTPSSSKPESEKKRKSKNNNNKNNNNNDHNNNKLNDKLVFGITISVVGLTIICIWKEAILGLGSSPETTQSIGKGDNIGLTKLRLSKSSLLDSISSISKNASNEVGSNSNTVNSSLTNELANLSSSFVDMISKEKDSIVHDIDQFGHFIVNSSWDMILRVRFTIAHFLELTTGFITDMVC